jgi:uncharacterized membrane protein YdjX (TVP38/TMEM64 family)
MRSTFSRYRAALAIVALALAAAAYFAVPGARETATALGQKVAAGDAGHAVESFRDYLLSFGLWAPIASAALMIAIQVAFIPIPTFFVTFANGLLFGWLAGAALSWSSSMVGAALCFWIAGSLGRPVAERLGGGTRALDAADVFFSRQGDRAVLIARLIPFLSFRAVSYAAGLTSMTIARFLIATGLGQVPATLLYSYFGGRLAHSVLILFWAASLTLALAIAGWAFGPRWLAARRGAASVATSETNSASVEP